MISGNNENLIRKASLQDLEDIKRITDEHRNELGFVLRPAITRSINNTELLIAVNDEGVIGFVEYHHRRDDQTTLYNIAVTNSYKRRGVGRSLVKALCKESKNFGKNRILLKCPENLPANKFYLHLGFQLSGFEKGKKRKLNVYSMSL